jgi:hypothetical protein
VLKTSILDRRKHRTIRKRLYPGMGRSVVHFKPTDVSDIYFASVFAVKEQAKQEISMNQHAVKTT